MIRTIVLATMATFLVAGAASAMDAKCDDATMSDMNNKIAAMTDAKAQKSAMHEMTMAGTAMKKHNMKSCMAHMDKAMKSIGTM